MRLEDECVDVSLPILPILVSCQVLIILCRHPLYSVYFRFGDGHLFCFLKYGSVGTISSYGIVPYHTIPQH